MYIEISKKTVKNKTYEYILLRESSRDKKSGKVIKRTIANLSNEEPEKVMALVNAFKGNKSINPDKMQQGKTIGFSMVIIFIMKLLGIFAVLGKSFEAKIAMVLIAARIVLQSSRLQALHWSQKVDSILDIVGFSENEKKRLNDKTIYKGLDYIEEHQEKIENQLFQRYYKDKPPKRVYYDVTSSYVEGEYIDSELIDYGYNRDGKKGKAQIVIGLLTDEEGHALSIHAYRGNTNDVKTFKDQLDKLKNRFNLENITIVGDGGMIKREDIATIKEMGYEYITSIGKASIKKLLKDQESQMEITLFDENLKEFVENDTRYVLRQNPIRMQEIREIREAKLKRLREFIEERVAYYNTHYKAKKETLESNITKKLATLKLSSLVSYQINYSEGECVVKDKEGNSVNKTKELAAIEIIIDEAKKKEEELLDGCYVVTTSLTDIKKETKEEIHQAYKNLIKVENAFKTLKTDYLEIRPLFLKSDKRIRGHIALSMLAYNIVLKLKSYMKLSELKFSDTIDLLKGVKTTPVALTKKVTVTYISTVCEELQKLFNVMGFRLPRKVNF
jgi:transposase